MLSAYSANAAIAHLSSLLRTRGVSPSTTALVLSMLGVSSIVGQLVTGYLLKRAFAPLISLAVLLFLCLGVVMLSYANTASAGLLGAFLRGWAVGAKQMSCHT